MPEINNENVVLGKKPEELNENEETEQSMDMAILESVNEKGYDITIGKLTIWLEMLKTLAKDEMMSQLAAETDKNEDGREE